MPSIGLVYQHDWRTEDTGHCGPYRWKVWRRLPSRQEVERQEANEPAKPVVVYQELDLTTLP